MRGRGGIDGMRQEAGPVRSLLGKGWAETDPEAANPKLRGRTYGIPFDTVWRCTLELVTERGRWTIMRNDDEAGIIEVIVETFVFRFVDDVRISITLDENGQTRVDVASSSRKGRVDFGTNRRRIGRFLRDLDRRLER
ncbi:MAG: DUF1499 domain-containing protein [Gemmatimonadota bacterium]